MRARGRLYPSRQSRRALGTRAPDVAVFVLSNGKNGHTIVRKKPQSGNTYEVAVGVAEWGDDERHCFLS
jgi:hypothetical protein